MSVIETYIPLYRKYRPQSFQDLVGQDVVSTALGNALSLGKIAHAFLFCGPRGTGKTSSARIFAKSLNCSQGPTITPCQTCESCVAITNGNALDVTEIDAASNNGVDSIRDLTDKVQFSPIQGKYKVYIIDEVHMLSTAAFNALLKTLEEPPPNVVFVFATTEPHKVLPTIISRCQRYDFSRITREQIQGRLQEVAEMERIAIAPEALALIARHVRGGMRDALGLLDQVSVLGRSQEGYTIQTTDIRRFIGSLEEDLLLALVDGILTQQPQAVIAQLGLFQDRGIEPTQLTKALIEHFRNLLLAKTCGQGANPDDLGIAPEQYPAILTQANQFKTEELPQMLNRLAQLETQIRHSHQPQLWLEVALLDLCYREGIAQIADLVERIRNLEEAIAQGKPLASTAPQQQAKPASTPPPVSAAVPQQAVPTPITPVQSVETNQPIPLPQQPIPAASSPAPLQQQAMISGHSDPVTLWADILHAVAHMPTQALLREHFVLTQSTETDLYIGYSTEAIYQLFKRTPEKTAHLEQAIQAVLGQSVKIHFKARSAESAPKPVPVASAPAPAIQLVQPAVTPEQEPILTATAPPPASPEAPVMAIEPQANIAPTPLPVPPEKPAVLEKPAFTSDEQDDLNQAKQYTMELLQAKSVD